MWEVCLYTHLKWWPVGHFSMPKEIAEIAQISDNNLWRSFFGGVDMWWTNKKVSEGLGHQADKHQYPCPKPFWWNSLPNTNLKQI